MLRRRKSSAKQEVRILQINSSLLSEEKEMELINSYSRKTLTNEQVYIFTVTLCDNEIDRDFEKFSTAALSALKELFVGKTGISDHSMRSKDQAARIFYCYTEEQKDKKTSTGEVYTALKARAYMVRTKNNEALIEEIDGGIKKEVSVGCAMNKCTCSVCGKDMKDFSCEHIKGKTYNGKLCFGILDNPTDAYEWSFVAVPAQRNAGVTKAYTKKEEAPMKKGIDVIKSMTDDTVITKAQASEILSYISELEALAHEARIYKAHLIEDISRFSMIIMPKVNAKQLTKSCEFMDVSQLKSFRDELEAQAREVLPISTQLNHTTDTKSKDNAVFMI